MLSRIQNRSHTDLGWRFGDIYPNFVTIMGTSFAFADSREADRNERSHAVSAQARSSSQIASCSGGLRRLTQWVAFNRPSLGFPRDPLVLILVASLEAAGIVSCMVAPRPQS